MKGSEFISTLISIRNKIFIICISLQAGRPVPNIPSVASTPTEYLEHGNPNLDSDSNSIATSNRDSVDDFFPLQDTASEATTQLAFNGQKPALDKDGFKIPAPPQMSKAPHYKGDDSDGDVGSELGNKSPRKTLDFNNQSLLSQNSDPPPVHVQSNGDAVEHLRVLERYQTNDMSVRNDLLNGQLPPHGMGLQQNGDVEQDHQTVAALLQDQLARMAQLSLGAQDMHPLHSVPDGLQRTMAGLQRFNFPPPPPGPPEEDIIIVEDEANGVPFDRYRNEQFPHDGRNEGYPVRGAGMMMRENRVLDFREDDQERVEEVVQEQVVEQVYEEEQDEFQEQQEEQVLSCICMPFLYAFHIYRYFNLIVSNLSRF